jgi:hypothetical protein
MSCCAISPWCCEYLKCGVGAWVSGGRASRKVLSNPFFDFLPGPKLKESRVALALARLGNICCKPIRVRYPGVGFISIEIKVRGTFSVSHYKQTSLMVQRRHLA